MLLSDFILTDYGLIVFVNSHSCFGIDAKPRILKEIAESI